MRRHNLRPSRPSVLVASSVGTAPDVASGVAGRGLRVGLMASLSLRKPGIVVDEAVCPEQEHEPT